MARTLILLDRGQVKSTLTDTGQQRVCAGALRRESRNDGKVTMDKYELLALLVLGLFLIPVGYLVFIFVISPLWSWLDERRKPKKTRDDPVFGRIEFEDGIWSSVPAEPLDFLMAIDAPETGPTESQRAFYLALRRELPCRVAECKAFISTHADAPSNLSGMTVYSVEIGSDEALERGQFVMELSDDQANEIHRVEFKNRKPKTYAVDD